MKSRFSVDILCWLLDFKYFKDRCKHVITYPNYLFKSNTKLKHYWIENLTSHHCYMVGSQFSKPSFPNIYLSEKLRAFMFIEAGCWIRTQFLLR